MMRFFKPEIDTRWPFYASTMDFCPFPANRMDSVFSLLQQSSLESLFCHEMTENDSFLCTPSSNNVAGLYTVLGGGFFIDTKDSDGFQLRTVSSTTTRKSLSPLNSIPKSLTRTADLLMTPQQSIAPTTVSRVQKMNKIVVRTGIESGMREGKRQKISSCPSWPTADAAVSPTRLAKTPARKTQKLGDRVTALQKLVSPSGKTDTASVLHEASICIKALHEQIQMLATPNLDEERYGLLGNGLCLAPITPTVVSLINHAELDSLYYELFATELRFRQ